ncbi:zinc ribbon domain-containing protein [Alkalihalobacterium chitinilyticum]|uniref:Zinc-ribbon domain-containing protein n=1 Tax=Alkalihalobacterium chitinilyticum TaxID=2980103 RepID=A0ABT5VEZ4_9BACI|nr:zinc-ribbon domain-containing protein [Alkalihalobacterium chitinilyticum]MDE5414033.1 zinc-ribbon domain-containing protein [Alkalihalobacterium chitinilyticum]
MKFCKECGSQLSEEAQFCKECGAPVTGRTTNSNPNVVKPSESTTTQGSNSKGTPPPMKPMTKKTKIWFAITGAAIILLFGGFKAGEALTDKDRLIDRFEAAVIANDEKTVAKFLTTTSGLEVNANSASGFIQYMNENPATFGEVISDLKMQSKMYSQMYSGSRGIVQDVFGLAEEFFSYGLVALSHEGKGILYDKYQLVVEPVYVTLSTEYKDVSLSINGEQVAVTDRPDFEKQFGPYYPGIMTLEATLNSDFVDLVYTNEIKALNSSVYHHVELDAESVTLDLGISSDAPVTAKLFINGEDVNVDPIKHSTFGPVLTDGSMTFNVEVEYPWGTFQTAEQSIESNYIEVDFSSDKDLQKQLVDLSLAFTKEFFPAHFSSDITKLTTTDSSFKEYFDTIVERNTASETIMTLKFLGMNFLNDSLTLHYNDNKWMATMAAMVEVDGSYVYIDWTEDEYLLPDASYKTFIYTYDTEVESWKVSNLYDIDANYEFQHTPLENLTKVENDNIVEFTSSWHGNAPVNREKESDTDTRSDTYVEEQVYDLMDSYSHKLIEAINKGDFRIVEPYLKSGSALYNDQKSLVEHLSNRGVKEEYVSSEILDVEIDGDTFYIETYEVTKIIYSNGNEEVKDFSWIYTGVFTGDDFLLTKIE